MHACTLLPSLPIEHPMSNQLIQSDPDVMMGKPVVRGTRVTVEAILRKLSSGELIEQFHAYMTETELVNAD